MHDGAREPKETAIKEQRWDGDGDQELMLIDSTDSAIPSRSQLHKFAACSVSE